MPEEAPECRSYEEAASAIGISPRKVRALALTQYLVRCPGHKRRVLVRSIEAEKAWRSSAPAWKRAARPLLFALRVVVAVIVEIVDGL
jgi:hypothetical protein